MIKQLLYRCAIPAISLLIGIFSANASSTVALPYQATFLNGDQQLWSVIDSNEDDITWGVTPDGICFIQTTESTDGDDWAISPAFHLEKGEYYEFKIQVVAGDSHGSVVEVKYGCGTDVSSLTHTILERCVVKDDSGTVSTWIVPEETGDYNIGIHATMGPREILFLRHFSLTDKQNMLAPAAPTDLKLTPDASGKNICEVSFTAPALDRKGDPLESLSFVEIICDDRVQDWIMPVEPGEKVTYQSKTTDGAHQYTVCATNLAGRGLETSQHVLVGALEPDVVQGITSTLRDDFKTVDISWQPVTADRGQKPISGVVYNVYTRDVNKNARKIAENLTATKYVYTHSGPQEILTFVVTASNAAGESYPNMDESMCVGDSYESWSDSGEHGYAFETEDVGAHWTVIEDNDRVQSSDGDNLLHMADLSSNNYGTADIVTGRIDLRKTPSPIFSFDLFVDNIDGKLNDNTLTVMVIDEKEGTVTPILSNKVASFSSSGRPRWYRNVVNLNRFKDIDARFIITASREGGNFDRIYLDNLRVESAPDYELSVYDIVVPEEVTRENKHTVKVSIQNQGVLNQSEYRVELLANGRSVSTKRQKYAIGLGRTLTANFRIDTEGTAEEEIEYQAILHCDLDNNRENNSSEKVVSKIFYNGLPEPLNLTAESTAEGILLNWDSPETASGRPDQTLEDFESATPFENRYDDWTFIDVDRMPVAGVPGIIVPDINPGITLGSFWTWEDGKIKDMYPLCASGKKCLVAFSRFDKGFIDDRAILPELSGHRQRISFKGMLTTCFYDMDVEIYISDTGKELDDFRLLKTVTLKMYEWQDYEFDVPEGTRFVSLRLFGNSVFIACLDNFRYASKDSEFNRDIIGYEIFRNGEKITGSPVDQLQYLDKEASGKDIEYRIAARYDNGVSGPSNVAVASTSGIAAISNGSDMVAGLTGMIQINPAKRAAISVATIAGQILFSDKADSCLEIAVPAGIYLVRIDNEAYKVLVK